MERLSIDVAPMDGTEILAICKDFCGKEYYCLVSYRYDYNDPLADVEEGEEIDEHMMENSWGKMWLDDQFDDFSCSMASCPHEPVAWIKLPPLNKDK